MTTEVSFGRWVQRRRQGLGLRTHELAARVAISVHTLRKIEIDERRPSRDVAALLADALRIPAAEREAFIHTARGESLVERLGDPAHEPAVQRERPPRLQEPLIGRDRDLAELGQWLTTEHPQVVTIAGLGGIGKTQLAIAAAHTHAGAFGDGCLFVTLAGIDAGALVPQQIARALGVALSGRAAPREQVARMLAQRHVLLVLDNIEHLLRETGDDALIETIAAIRDRAPGVKLLLTSREPTRIAGEWVFGLRGLTVPGEGDDLASSDAAALFIRQAGRVRQDAPLPTADRDAIVAICRATAGLPLAIELAAAWTRVLSPREIADRLRNDLTLLESQRRDLPPRQRSLRATFAHSWQLLAPDERRTLARLAVFREGCAPDAAIRVAETSLPILASLLDQSLLRRDDGADGGARFAMHELVRQFAVERLREDAATEAETRDRHAAYFLDAIGARERDLCGYQQLDVLNALKPDLDNLRAAWDWALTRERFDLIARADAAFSYLHQMMGTFREAHSQHQRASEAIERAIERDGDLRGRQRTLGLLLTRRGLAAFRLGNVGALAHDVERGLALLEPLGDDAALMGALSIGSIYPNLSGQLDLARERLQRARAIAICLHDDLSLMVVDGQIGQNDLHRGELHRAYAQLRDVVRRAHAIGDATYVGIISAFLCRVCFTLGKPTEAQAVAEAAIPLLSRIGERYGLAEAYIAIATARLMQGDAAGALTQAQRARALGEAIAANGHVISALNVEGQALALLGDPLAARQALIAALQLGVSMHADQFTLSLFCSLAEIALGDDEHAPAWLALVQAHPATVLHVRERAGQLLTTWATSAQPDAIEAAHTRAAAASLEEMIRELGIGVEASSRRVAT